MALTPLEAERAEFSSRRGEPLARTWTRDGAGRTYDNDVAPLIEWRTGDHEDTDLVASSVVSRQGPAVAAVTTTGSNLTATDPVIAFQWTAAESEKLPRGELYVHVKASVGGEYVTVLPPRVWWHDPQVAVAP